MRLSARGRHLRPRNSKEETQRFASGLVDAAGRAVQDRQASFQTQVRMYRSSVYQAVTPLVLRGFGPVHVALYRLLRGRLVGRISQGFMPVLLLTTVGRRSGRRRTQPVGYVRDGDAMLVIASNGALTSHPGWYFNLRANPAAQVELGSERMNVNSTILLGEERERAWVP